MRERNDWRLTNQRNYLQNAELSWSQYAAPSADWDHDHCAFCMQKFMPGTVDAEGYVTADDQHWVCKACFEDFKQEFGFKVV
jgi:hypothetical protein